MGRDQGEGGTASGRGDFDPAVVVAEGDVGDDREAKLRRVEADRLVLVGNGDHDPSQFLAILGIIASFLNCSRS